MTTAFDRAMTWLLHGGYGWAGEGGSSSDPADRAAAAVGAGMIHTRLGVTQDTYTDWRLAKGELPRPVWEIEDAEVAAIYFQNFWRAAWCDRLAALPAPDLALCVLDGAVQHGPDESVRLWQRVVRTVPDGVPGPTTLLCTEARRAQVGEQALCSAYLDRRVGLYETLILRDPSQVRFRRGWMRRMNALAQTVGLTPLWTN